ncbi:unnamed protein product [Urochloa humidicola]
MMLQRCIKRDQRRQSYLLSGFSLQSSEKQQSEPNLLTYSRWAMRLDAESEKRIQVRPELVLISDGYFDIKVLNATDMDGKDNTL